MLESLQPRRTGLLLLPLAAVSIFIINLVGWSLARLLPDEGFMPLGYTTIFRREP